MHVFSTWTGTTATATTGYYTNGYYNPYYVKPLWEPAVPRREPTFAEKLQTEIDMWLSEFD